MITGFNKACDDETVCWREGDNLSVREREMEGGIGERDWEAGYESCRDIHMRISLCICQNSLCIAGVAYIFYRQVYMADSDSVNAVYRMIKY